MRILLALFLLAGCAEVFDSEEQAITDMEKYAAAHGQFYRPDVRIEYVFADDVQAECERRGLRLRNYLAPGQASMDYKVNGCAIIADPCVIILPYAPTKLLVEHEREHCKRGNWHGGA